MLHTDLAASPRSSRRLSTSPPSPRSTLISKLDQKSKDRVATHRPVKSADQEIQMAHQAGSPSVKSAKKKKIDNSKPSSKPGARGTVISNYDQRLPIPKPAYVETNPPSSPRRPMPRSPSERRANVRDAGLQGRNECVVVGSKQDNTPRGNRNDSKSNKTTKTRQIGDIKLLKEHNDRAELNNFLQVLTDLQPMTAGKTMCPLEYFEQALKKGHKVFIEDFEFVKACRMMGISLPRGFYSEGLQSSSLVPGNIKMIRLKRSMLWPLSEHLGEDLPSLSAKDFLHLMGYKRRVSFSQASPQIVAV